MFSLAPIIQFNVQPIFCDYVIVDEKLNAMYLVVLFPVALRARVSII